jgi:hypothetical protein
VRLGGQCATSANDATWLSSVFRSAAWAKPTSVIFHIFRFDPCLKLKTCTKGHKVLAGLELGGRGLGGDLLGDDDAIPEGARAVAGPHGLESTQKGQDLAA